MRVMTIGAHAFDAEVLAGGLLAKYTSQGHSGMLVHMTLGERGDPTKKPEAYAAQLKDEMLQAARILGSAVKWMGYPAGQLPISEEVALSLCQVIREFQPDLVITHWRGSWHPRHVATHFDVIRAIQLAASEEVECGGSAHCISELYFGENCEDLDGFRPSIFFDITAAFETWFQALACYELFRRSMPTCGNEQHSELGIPYAEYYRAMARVRGLEAGFTYAQAFMPARRAVSELPQYTTSGVQLGVSHMI